MTNEINQAIIGANIRDYRESSGMSVEALADKSGIKLQRLINIESGKVKRITADEIIDIATALNASIDLLISGSYTFEDIHTPSGAD